MPTIDDLLTPSQAGRLVPGGPVSPISIWRWCRKGLRTPDGRQVFLKSYKAGRKLCTTRTDLVEFFAAAGECHLGKYLDSVGQRPHASQTTEKEQAGN